MTDQSRIVAWVEEIMRREDLPGRLARLSVVHVVRGNKIGDEIRSVSVPDRPDVEWLEGTADRIVEQATGEALTLAAGIQRYAVYAYFTGAAEKPQGRHLFVCQGTDDVAGAVTEGPDVEGLVAQSQRHVEFFAKLAATQTNVQLKAMQEENGALRRECAELRAERVKVFRTMEDLYSAAAERELARRQADVKVKLMENAGEKLGLMLPIAINHMAGRKVLPEAAASSLLLKSLVDSITPDQLGRLETVLRGDQLAALLTLAQQVSRPADDGKAAAAPAPAPNGVAS